MGKKTPARFHYCFTVYGLDRYEVYAIFMRGHQDGTVPLQFLIVADETGEADPPNPHVQGYVELLRGSVIPKNGWLISTIKEHIPEAADWHFEERRGTQDQAATYCYKEGCWTDFGSLWESKQGRRSDLTKLAKRVVDGKLDEIIKDDPGSYMEFYRGLHALANVAAPRLRPLKERPRATLVFGPPGKGKSTFVETMLQDQWDHVYRPEAPNADRGALWWDGVRTGDIIWIEDLKPGFIPPALLLKLLDRRPVRLPVKCSFTEARPTWIIIDTRLPPSEWYDKKYASLDEISRRFTELYIPGSADYSFERVDLLSDGSPSSALAVAIQALHDNFTT